MVITGFGHTNKGGKCSDISMRDLLNYQQCKLAWSYAISINKNAQYIKWDFWYNYPKGCYINDVGEMYFNGHETGESQPNSRTICQSGNK